MLRHFGQWSYGGGMIHLDLGSRFSGGDRDFLHGLGRSVQLSCDCQSDAGLNSQNFNEVRVCNK